MGGRFNKPDRPYKLLNKLILFICQYLSESLAFFSSVCDEKKSNFSQEWQKVTETYPCFLLDQTVNWTVRSLPKQC